MQVVTLTAKNQLTLSADLVRVMGLKKGSRLLARVLGENLLGLEKRDLSLRGMQGFVSEKMLPKKYRKLAMEKIIKLAQEKEAERIANEA